MDKRKKILLIDNDPDVLSFLRNTIESDKYQVITAMSGIEGLNKFNIEKPVLVIYEMIKEEASYWMETVNLMREKDKNVKIYMLGNMNPGVLQVYYRIWMFASSERMVCLRNR
ncbi:MAG: hypothetical protein JW864_02140 [Spirochaetes bacterium]|nr:hypothetical protein [Spirochaetota bacterium]